jgi:membrane associated rhomboid family serine protease
MIQKIITILNSRSELFSGSNTTIDQNTPDWNFTQHYGIRARDMNGILGIFLAPFLHVNYPHLIGNTLPFLALGGLVLLV